MKGKWKAVELDPGLFSEEGLEGLVCFEELKNYRLVDSEKVAVKAAKELEKKKKKKNAKKRKASERKEDGEKVDVSKEGEETSEPPKKKAKKKNKQNAKESVQLGDISAEAAQEDVAADEDELVKEDTSSDLTGQSKPASKGKKKKKKRKQMQQREKDTVPGGQPEQVSPSNLQAKGKKSCKVQATAPPKKQQKNWTNAALSGCNDKNTDVSAWKDLFVPSPVLKALSALGFGSPTPIQALALPSAIRDHMDILGAAETGKTEYVIVMSCNTPLSCLHK